MLAKFVRLITFVGLVCAFGVPRSTAFTFFNPIAVWPEGTIPIDLQLGSPSGVLIDGNTSWDRVAEGALATWNSWFNTVQFTVYAQHQGTSVNHDGVNQVFFASTVYGQSFGQNTLAVTKSWRIGTVRTDDDTVFNVAKSWNSYRGDLRNAAGGGILNDLRRVALHEFGHSLGLDHPDQAGQNVYALMNSTIGDLDGLTVDDVNGAQALYYRLPPTITSQPQSAAVPVGSSVTFSVVANGIPAPRYQWYWKGTLQPGVTNASVTYSGVQTNYAGAFHVVVSNSRGTVTSSQAVLTVLYQPVITAQPQSRTVLKGQSASFSIAANGVPSPNYQWFLNGSPIPGAVGSTYAILSTQDNESGDYTVSVSNPQGSLTSVPAVLTVQSPPTITEQPQSATVTVGNSVTFSAVAAGVPAPTYQWYWKGTVLASANSPTLVISNVQPESAGGYRVVVNNARGSVTSDTAVLTVLYPPEITAQPQSRTAAIGQRVDFSASVKGFPAPTYQWHLNGNPIPGAVGSTHTIFSVQNSDGGDYTLSATNSQGGTASETATLQVFPVPLAVVLLPTNQIVFVKTNVVLAADVVSVGSFTCQWLRNGRTLRGQTNATLHLPNISLNARGNYQLEVRNAFAVVRSGPVQVIVVVPPTIVSQPRAITAKIGKRAALRVSAKGTKPLTYQWFKDGVLIPGATSQWFKILRTQATDAGVYSARVTNIGASQESVLAQLSVIP